jgi:Protein kinase domain
MIGTRLGSWVLEREIGRGGMGCVYLGRRAEGVSSEIPERAAVKVLAAHLTFDPGLLSRFEREIDVLRKLDYPGIVRLLEAGIEGGRHFYAMEYVEGESYEAFLERESRIPWPEVLDMTLQVCLALKHAHDRGVIHRDLKPSNLLRGAPIFQEGVGQYGVVKLTDFGIAWVFAGEHLTVTGSYVGTPEYLSPEQAAGKQPTKRSDLYSLGVVLYVLLTGRLPFEGEPLDLLHKHRYAQFDRPGRLAPDLPHDLEEVVCQLLEKDPDRRPADAGALHKKLDSLRRKYERRAAQGTVHGGEDTSPGEGRERRRRTGPATLMAKLVREELDQQTRGGPIRRFFNRPLVLVTLFVLTVGLIVYTFLPASADTLFEKGSALAHSEEAADWYEAREALEKLQNRYPEHRKEEVAALRKDVERKLDSVQDLKRETLSARFSGPMSEAHWFYEKGLRLRQQGEEKEAKAVWRNLVQAFGDIEAAHPWVERARRELESPSGRERKGEDRWGPVRHALRQAHDLEVQGKPAEAEAIRQALRSLYADDPSARAVLER